MDPLIWDHGDGVPAGRLHLVGHALVKEERDPLLAQAARCPIHFFDLAHYLFANAKFGAEAANQRLFCGAIRAIGGAGEDRVIEHGAWALGDRPAAGRQGKEILIGKTRLALALGGECRAAFADGVCFVPLAALSTPSELAPAIATALGLALQGSDPRTMLRQSLREQCLLLILDNVEHLLAAGSTAPDAPAQGAVDTLRLWDVATGRCLHVQKEGHVGSHTVAFSPDGATLAYGGDDFAIYLWRWRTDAAPIALQGHTGLTFSLDFSPTAPLLVSCSVDNSLRLWDLTTYRCCQVLCTPGPYAGMQITGVTGISEAQKAALRALGAVAE